MLKNLSVRYDPKQDRLVLGLQLVKPDQTVELHELLLTRRLCATWRRDLQAMIDRSAQAPDSLDPAARKVVSKAHHDAVANQATVHRAPAPDPADPPPVEPPTLVTAIRCGQRRTDRRWVLQFQRDGRPTLNLLLASSTLHAMVDAISRRVRAADWRLDPIPADQPAPTVPAVAASFH